MLLDPVQLPTLLLAMSRFILLVWPGTIQWWQTPSDSDSTWTEWIVHPCSISHLHCPRDFRQGSAGRHCCIWPLGHSPKRFSVYLTPCTFLFLRIKMATKRTKERETEKKSSTGNLRVTFDYTKHAIQTSIDKDETQNTSRVSNLHKTGRTVTLTRPS